MNGKEEKVRDIFKSISGKYDLIDSMMSFGLDQLWRAKLISELDVKDGQGILDVGCGTGKISYSIEKIIKNSRIYALDLTKEMYPFIPDSKVTFVVGSAMSLPFEDNSMDRVVSGFLTRNVPSLEKYISEVYRILKPGGIFCNLDIFEPGSHFIAPLFRFYFYRIVPTIFDRMTGTDSYSYLARSVREFVSPSAFESILDKYGFGNIKEFKRGGGSVFIHKALK
ncbi:MAG: ubiquinone/menaquinone biosynthesis methyltransferase [Thermoplasmataceae archaeon]